MNKEENSIFKLLSGLSDEEQMQLLEQFNIGDCELDEITKKRMKRNTLNKIKNSAFKERQKSKRRILTACLVAFIVFIFIPFGGKSLADVIARFIFLPGVGRVEQDKGSEIFVLPASIKVQCNGDELVIKAVTKQEGRLFIRIQGTNASGLDYIKNAVITDSKGNQYNGRLGWTEASGSWLAEIWFNNMPQDLVSFTLSLPEGKQVPITLKKAASYDDFADMGPTDKRNGVGITLIPSREGDNIKLDLIQHPEKDRVISSFQKAVKDGVITEISAKDQNGKTYDVHHDKQYIGLQNEFYLNPDIEADKFTVEINEIQLKYNALLGTEISLTIPEEGELTINKTVSVNDFKFSIKKVQKQGRKLRVFVDTNYDSNRAENLSEITMDIINGEPGGYMWHLNDNSDVEYYEFDIDAKDKEIKLKLGEVYTRMRGPWIFQFSKDMIK